MASAPCRTPKLRKLELEIVIEPSIWAWPPQCDDDLLPAPTTYPIQPLSVLVEWQRVCELSGREEKFVADRVCYFGFIGECTHCGEERIAPFTRTGGVE